MYTGAAGFIGSAAVAAMARAGANLILVDPNIEGLLRLRGQLEEMAPQCRILTSSDLDSTDSTSIERLLDKAEGEIGPIDCLINSAYPRTDDWHLDFLKTPVSSWKQNVDQHMNGYVLLSQGCARRMVPRRSGNIIFFSSIYGLVGPDFGVYDAVDGMTMPAAYAAIKGGISNFTRYLAAYLGPHGIRVNAICPGGVENGQHPSFVAAYKKRVPMRRMAGLDDVVGPLMFLVSDASKYVTGINLAVDGGWTAI